MKKIFLLILVISLCLIAGTYAWWSYALSPVAPSQTPKYFSIAPGESAGQIVSRLQKEGLIRSSLAARIYLRFTGIDSRVKPGGYSLTSGLTTPQVLTALNTGPKDIWVTIPEGWRREQIATRLAETFSQFDSQTFLDLTSTLEGHLFPDTYLFPQGLTPQSAVTFLTENFAKKSGINLNQEYSLLSGSLNLSAKEVITMASLLEREAANDQDVSVIAGILLKRLQADWPLQVDASVQFVQDTLKCRANPLSCNYWEPISDTSTPSAYNTYLHPGLPPGPVSNPGQVTISAVLNSTPSPYWFYLHSEDGTVHYATTLAEHQLNIDKYLTP